MHCYASLPLPWDYNQDGCSGGNSRRDVDGEPGAQISSPGQFIGCQLNAEVPRRWSSSEDRPGHDDLEQRAPSQGHLFCKVLECCSKSRRQKSQRNRLHSALCLAELSNGVLYLRLLG